MSYDFDNDKNDDFDQIDLKTVDLSMDDSPEQDHQEIELEITPNHPSHDFSQGNPTVCAVPPTVADSNRSDAQGITKYSMSWPEFKSRFCGCNRTSRINCYKSGVFHGIFLALALIFAIGAIVGLAFGVKYYDTKEHMLEGAMTALFFCCIFLSIGSCVTLTLLKQCCLSSNEQNSNEQNSNEQSV